MAALCDARKFTYDGHAPLFRRCMPCPEALHEAVQKKLNASDEQWADRVKQMTGHPNEEDVANARACVREVLG